jgi:hypothetical protein
MLKRVLILLLLAVEFSGCQRSVTKDTIAKIKQQCGNDTNCILVLNDVTKFKWDKVYFFPNWTTPDSITAAIKIRYEDDVPDQFTRMLFTYRGKVVHEEDYPELDYNNSMIDFGQGLNIIGSWGIDQDKAIFKVSKSKLDNSCSSCFSYYLTPINKKQLQF